MSLTYALKLGYGIEYINVRVQKFDKVLLKIYKNSFNSF